MEIRPLFTVFVPDNFVASDFIPTKTSRKQELEDALNYVVATVLHRMMSEKGRDEFEVTGMVRISTEILDSLVGRSYKRAIDLLDDKVLQINKSYVVGSICRGYRLFPRYLSSLTKETTIKSALINRRLWAREDASQNRLTELHCYPVMNKWLKDSRFDNKHIQETQYYIESLKSQLLKKAGAFVDENKKDSAYLDELKYRIGTRFASQKVYMTQLESRAFQLSRDDKGGRIYSPLTSMFKNLRHFYTFDGQQLTSLDIKTSQPYLFLKMVKKDYWEQDHPTSLHQTHPHLYNTLKERNTLEQINTLWDSHGCNQSNWASTYANCIMNGDIYLTIAKMIKSFDESNACVRKEMRAKGKGKMMWFMYDRTTKTAPLPIYQTFRKTFKFEASLMEGIKQKGHELFPIILQAIEAHVILSCIVPRITDEYPELPVFTVHDSIITLTSHYERVKSIMEDELNKFVGFPAKIDCEHFSPDTPNNTVDAEAGEVFQAILKSITAQERAFKKQNGDRGVGEFYFDLKSLNMPWKPVMPIWNGSTILSTRLVEEISDIAEDFDESLPYINDGEG